MANATTTPFSTPAPHVGATTWLALAYRYGFPAAVAAFLIYFVTHVIAADIKAVKDGQQQMQVEHTAIRSEMGELLRETRTNNAREAKQLWAVCMVIADGDPISQRWCEVGQ